MNNTLIPKSEDGIISALKQIYENAGFRAFKMHKFEEYSLYVENKDFLPTEYVIVFNDPNGKLLALKPDVTLSMVKNTKATPASSEKLWYRERVYRFDKHAREYREINQVGLELLGNIDAVAELEAALLALRSLAAISDRYMLQISHMGLIAGILHRCGIARFEKEQEILACLASKNAHDLSRLTTALNMPKQHAALLTFLAQSGGSAKETLARMRPLITTDETLREYEELCALCESLSALGYADRIKLDFSGVNAMEYYTGVVFRGYIEGIAAPVLSGGRYDRLAEKFAVGIGAIGFAVYLAELLYHQKPGEYDTDVLLLYADTSDPAEVLRTAEQLRAKGRGVRVEPTVPAGLRYREIHRV
ncbi:MAG: ATP phosphoribosyltransferase regulatory subunit [Eubacteriales bacterium]